MIEKKLSIGIDISKRTLDICVMGEGVLDHYSIKNNQKSIKSFIHNTKKKYGVKRVELCMENTGLYNWPLYSVCDELEIPIFVINPFHLKRSVGLVRGKNDKIDAERIASYIKRFYEDHKPYIIPAAIIHKLQVMLGLRKRIMKAKNMFRTPMIELKSVADKEIYSKALEVTNLVVKQLDAALLKVEKELHQLIKEDETIQENYKYMTSVQGVGKVLAWNLLIKTNNFKTLNDPKKIACYVGVVPFEHQSGTSLKMQPRVSHMADKQVKKVLHMAALRAVRLDGDLKKYYTKKITEGKNKMSAINAVRNKLIARICSVVNNKKNYVPNLLLS
jgi:transposase